MISLEQKLISKSDPLFKALTCEHINTNKSYNFDMKATYLYSIHKPDKVKESFGKQICEFLKRRKGWLNR